mgnify:CR=1 FL=1
MALALILTTIAPEVGGVLVRGEKGTAKSTIVRALAAVLPPVDDRPVPLVELPIGATEDRVTGSINLESALAEGRAEYEPGLLAKAHRGILYVDEVNLLHDHLVDLLLDAAAMRAVMPAEHWYVLSALLAPTGYMVQDVVADAMTVEAVPRVDEHGVAIPDETQKLMHTTMQSLGRVAVIGGGIAVALVNVLEIGRAHV